MDKKHYNLFLDDERSPSVVTWIELPLVHWVIVRSYNQFVETILKFGVPNCITFDHDLAEEHYQEYHLAIERGYIDYTKLKEKTGYDCAKWLAEHCIDNKIDIPTYYIHTLNGIGKRNISVILESAKQAIKNDN